MVFCHTFSNISKRASTKAPSFFDSSYHLRNYTQLATPDLFTSNTSRGEHYNHNTNNHNNNFPKFQNGIYSYTLILDPYTSGLALYNSTNNNNNSHSPTKNNNANIKLFNFTDESQNLTSNKFLINIPNTISTVNESLKYTKSTTTTTTIAGNNNTTILVSPKSIQKSSKSNVVSKNSVSKNVTKKALGSKRSYTTVASPSLASSKKNKLDDAIVEVDPLLLKISGVAPPTEQPIMPSQEDSQIPAYFNQFIQQIQQQQEKYSQSSLKRQHLKYITDLISQSLGDDDSIVFSNLLRGMRDAIATDNYLKVFPIYQAMKRNQCAISVALYNIILYNMYCLRDIPGECIESKLTSVLNVYSDLISMKMKPDTQSYSLVINSLLQGAFKSYDLYLNRNSQELVIDDDGKLDCLKSNNGENFFRLALEIFMACNFTNLQKFDQDLYESLLMGLNLFNYRFKNFVTFQKFLDVLNSSTSFKKNGFYYINMIKYSTNLEHIVGAEEEEGNTIGFNFLLETYNEYKSRSKQDLYLLSSQYRVYAVLMYSLCQFNSANTATKILDNILLSSKLGKVSGSYTSAFEHSNSSMVNQVAEIHSVIMFYLHSLLTVSTSKSLELFEKFKKFDMIVMNSDIVKQYFINLMIICCSNLGSANSVDQQKNIQTASYIFDKYFVNEDESKMGSKALFKYNNSEDYVISSMNDNSNFDKCKFLMKSIIKSHQPDVFNSVTNNDCNSLNKAMSMYFMLCLNVNNLKHVEMFLKFEDDKSGSIRLSDSSLQLIKYLNEESVSCLIIVAIMNKFSKEEIFTLLDSVASVKKIVNEDCANSEMLYAGIADIYLNGFQVNGTLSKLCQDSRFIEFLKHSDENLTKFANGEFFKSCVSEFSVKSFILSCETSSNFHGNKYMGLIHTWYELLRINRFEVIEGCSNSSYFKNLLNVILEEFNNIDHYYLMHNIKSELIEKKFTAGQQNMSVAESNFLGQLNILEIFKNDIMCSVK